MECVIYVVCVCVCGGEYVKYDRLRAPYLLVSEDRTANGAKHETVAVSLSLHGGKVELPS